MAFEIRDRHGASRSIAYLQFVGAPYTLFTGVFLPGEQPPPAIIVAILATTAALALGGWVCWSRPQALPDAFYWAAPLIATVVISGLNLMTNDTTTGPQLFYLWPVLYAASFLSKRVIYMNIAVVSAGEAFVLIIALNAPNGFPDWIALTIALTMTAVVVVTMRDRADRLRSKLEEQAFGDPLTGLANRRAFDDALATAGEWAERTGRPLAVVTIDLDYFKTINDTYGHATGDEALRVVAQAMRKVATEEDVVGRLGGDEFVMLLRADERAALRAVEELLARIGEDTTLPSGPPGLSIGVASLPLHAETIDGLVRASDAALYTAKSGGRGRVSLAGTRRVSPPPTPAPDPQSPQPARAR